MISNELIQTLCHLPIEEVSQRLGLQVARHKALCPFHNDTHPSMTFHTAYNRYRCFVCNAHGSTIDLAMHLLHLPFADACRALANLFYLPLTPPPNYPTHGKTTPASTKGTPPRSGCGGAQGVGSATVQKALSTATQGALSTATQGALRGAGNEAECGGENKVGNEAVQGAAQGCARAAAIDAAPAATRSSGPDWEPIPSAEMERLHALTAHPVLSPEAVNFLSAQRKINLAVVKWCRIGSTHSHLIIPYYDSHSALQSVQWRYLGSNPAVPRFQFPRGSHCHIYNLPILALLRPGEPLYITEGCSDCWAMLSAGRKALAIPSASLLKKDDVAPLKGLNLHMFPDQDLPGERLFLQLRNLLPQLVRHQLPPDCKDFAELWLKHLYHPPSTHNDNPAHSILT